jgi:hypothetical protein
MLASNRFWDHLLTKCHTLSQHGKSAKFKVQQQKLNQSTKCISQSLNFSGKCHTKWCCYQCWLKHIHSPRVSSVLPVPIPMTPWVCPSKWTFVHLKQSRIEWVMSKMIILLCFAYNSAITEPFWMNKDLFWRLQVGKSLPIWVMESCAILYVKELQWSKRKVSIAGADCLKMMILTVLHPPSHHLHSH